MRSAFIFHLLYGSLLCSGLACCSLVQMRDDTQALRVASWLSYFYGLDIRRICTVTLPDRYRLVFRKSEPDRFEVADVAADTASMGGFLSTRLLLRDEMGLTEGIEPEPAPPSWSNGLRLLPQQFAALVQRVDSLIAAKPLADHQAGFDWSISGCRSGKWFSLRGDYPPAAPVLPIEF